MIPENKQLAVTKALHKAFNTDAFENIQQLTKGLSGALVFKIAVQGIPYLLRIITRSETRDKPEYYFDCLQTAANAGFAPASRHRSATGAGQGGIRSSNPGPRSALAARPG